MGTRRGAGSARLAEGAAIAIGRRARRTFRRMMADFFFLDWEKIEEVGRTSWRRKDEDVWTALLAWNGSEEERRKRVEEKVDKEVLFISDQMPLHSGISRAAPSLGTTKLKSTIVKVDHLPKAEVDMMALSAAHRQRNNRRASSVWEGRSRSASTSCQP